MSLLAITGSLGFAVVEALAIIAIALAFVL